MVWKVKYTDKMNINILEFDLFYQSNKIYKIYEKWYIIKKTL